MASPRPSRLAALAAVTLAAAFAKATSIVPPENLGELARMSDAVVLAQAGSSSAVPAGPLLFTHTTFRVMEAVTGPLSTGDHIKVRVPGGDLADSGWLVPGAPRFDPGQVYLLFLHRKNTGQWLPQAMAYGLLRRVAGRDGSILLAPVPEAADVEPFPRPDGILPEKVETYREATLVAHLRAVASGSAEWSARRVLAAGDQVPIEVQAQSVPSSCRYITAPNPPSPTPPPPFPRWPYNTSSSPGQVNIYYSPSGGDASVSGGGIAQLQGAVNGWMGIPNISLDLAYAGLKSGYTMSCTDTSCMSGSDPIPCYGDFANAGVVVFNDPCGEVPAGTELGFGGPWWGSTHTFDGFTWDSIVSQFVVVSAKAASGLGGNLTSYQEMLTHELGHGLGYGHSADSSSVMYYLCCNPIDSTDVSCTQYTYPGSGPTPTPTRTFTPTGPTPTPTWTPTAGPSPTPTWTPTPGPSPTPTPTTAAAPPAPPTGVSASDGAYANEVRVTWNPSASATAYQVWRNTANDSSTATYLSGTSGTLYDDATASPGVVYDYWVRAGNGAGWSGFSSPDTGYSGTTTPTPAAPTATPTATPTPIPTSPGPTPSITPTPTPGGLAASFTWTPIAPATGQRTQFTDTSTGVPRSWQWTFGDGSASTDRNPVHAWAKWGTYTVTLAVGNGSTTVQSSTTIKVDARARRHLS